MKKLRFGIVGTGRIGKLHVENITYYLDNAEVVALADIYIEYAEEWAGKFGITALYKDYQDLINDENVDAVIVASSTDTHAEISIAAAKAGKDVFCEKPVDMNVDRVKEVMQVVEEAGVKFQVGFNRRFDRNFKQVQEIVESGQIGDPHIIRISSRDPAPPPVEYIERSGGLFKDMMIHDFDMARYLSGSEPVEISAKGACLVDKAIGEAGDIDTAVVTIKMENGALVVIDNSRQAIYGYDQRVEVFGSKGMADAQNERNSTVQVHTEDGTQLDKIPYFFLDRYTGAFIDQFRAFVDAVLKDKPTPVDAFAGLQSLVMAEAAQESFETNKPVSLK